MDDFWSSVPANNNDNANFMDNSFTGNGNMDDSNANNNDFGTFVTNFDQNTTNKNRNSAMNGGQARVLKKKPANPDNDPFMDLLSFN